MNSSQFRKKEWSVTKTDNGFLIENQKDKDLMIQILEGKKPEIPENAAYTYADILQKSIKRLKELLDGDRKNLRNVFFKVADGVTKIFVTNAYIAFEKEEKNKLFSKDGEYFVSIHAIQFIEKMSPTQKVYAWKTEDEYFYICGNDWIVRTDRYKCPNIQDVFPKDDPKGNFIINKTDKPIDINIDIHGTGEKEIKAHKYVTNSNDEVFINPNYQDTLFKIVDTFKYTVQYYGKNRPMVCLPLVHNPYAYKILIMPMYMGE